MPDGFRSKLPADAEKGKSDMVSDVNVRQSAGDHNNDGGLTPSSVLQITAIGNNNCKCYWPIVSLAASVLYALLVEYDNMYVAMFGKVKEKS